jgi:hypothetical protein
MQARGAGPPANARNNSLGTTFLAWLRAAVRLLRRPQELNYKKKTVMVWSLLNQNSTGELVV